MRNFKIALVATAIFMSTLFVLANTLPESEPNNTQSTAQTIMLNDSIVGNIIDSVDEDWYKVDLQQGAYKLVIDYPTNPATRDWFELVDQNGEEIESQCYYPAVGVQLAYFKVCANQVAFLHVLYNEDFGASNANYQISFADDFMEDPNECNDGNATARIIPEPMVVNGKFALRTDKEVFKINASAGVFAISANNAQQSGLLFDIQLFQGNNATPIASTTAGNDLNFNLPADGSYYISLKYANDTMSMFPFAASFLYVAGTACNLTIDTAAVVSTPSICGQAAGTLAIPQPSDGVAPFTYVINGGAAQANAEFTNLTDGSYQVLVTDANGCTAEFATEVTCTTCDLPQIGISNAFVTGKTVQLIVTQQFVDSISVNTGDFSTPSDSLSHTYLTNGDYVVTITAYNSCGSSTATTTVSIRSAKFRLGWKDNVQVGDTVKLPLIVEEGSYQVSGYTGTVSLQNPSMGTFAGLESGNLNTNSAVINFANGRFAGIAPAAVNETFEVGDTVIYIKIIATGGNPGDSTIVDLNGILPFEFSIFFNNTPMPVSTSLITGGFSLVHNVEFRLNFTTPNGIPTQGVKVTFTSPDSTIIDSSDVNGNLIRTLPYSSTYNVNFSKQKEILAGINTIDAVYIPRILVGLTTVGLTPYSYIAAARVIAPFDQITISDASEILNILVGNSPIPADQIVIIPSDHVFPAYPDPQYFNYPTSVTVTNPDPVNGVDISAKVVITCDVNHSAYPNAQGNVDDRNHANTTWFSAVEVQNGLTHVLLTPEDIEKMAAGYAQFNFDAAAFDFVSAEFVQAKSEHLMTLNTQEARSGSIKMAFLNQKGCVSHWDSSLPLIDVVFRAKSIGATDPKLTLANIPNVSNEVINPAGEEFELVLERKEKLVDMGLNSMKIFPNPASQKVSINLPGRENATIEIFNMVGHKVYSAESVGNLQFEIPLNDFSTGTYLCRVASNGQSFTQRLEIIK